MERPRQINDHPNWTDEADAAYLKWYVRQSTDPAATFPDPRIAFALQTQLITDADAEHYASRD